MLEWATVIETEPYLAVAGKLLSESERIKIVDMIARQPDLGDVIQGSGGLRKARVPVGGRGKRGGARVITFFHDPGMPVFLLALYAKNVQSDLDTRQRAAMARLVQDIKEQYRRR